MSEATTTAQVIDDDGEILIQRISGDTVTDLVTVTFEPVFVYDEISEQWEFDSYDTLDAARSAARTAGWELGDHLVAGDIGDIYEAHRVTDAVR